MSLRVRSSIEIYLIETALVDRLIFDEFRRFRLFQLKEDITPIDGVARQAVGKAEMMFIYKSAPWQIGCDQALQSFHDNRVFVVGHSRRRTWF